MRIGELAERAGCDVQTVRFYEREGLLEAPVRDTSGYRSYDERHAARLAFVRHCRSLDLPLHEVRQLLDFAAQPAQSCGQVNELLDGHIALVKQRLSALHALEKQLVALRRSCDGDASHPCAILESFMTTASAHACACHAAVGQQPGELPAAHGSNLLRGTPAGTRIAASCASELKEPRMSKKTAPSKNPAVKNDPQAKKEADRAQAALDNNNRQDERAAGNATGLGSVGSARDMTSGKRSGNQ
jgi:Cd(II)/Pb(II)-responsive transcriptional regulator